MGPSATIVSVMAVGNWSPTEVTATSRTIVANANVASSMAK